jgi:hypothetical protein
MRWSSVALVCVFAAAIGGTASAGGDPAVPTDSVDDAEAWLSARGVKNAAKQLGDVCCCVEVIVGTGSERALRCSEAKTLPLEGSYTIVVSEVVRVVRAGKAVTVLEVLSSLQNLDDPPGARAVLKLGVTVDPKGLAATVTDPGDSRNRCDALPPRSADKTTSERVYRKWIDRICDSRGTHRWRRGRFVRTAR